MPSIADLERARLLQELNLSEPSSFSLADLQLMAAEQAISVTNSLGTLAYSENTTGVVTAIPVPGSFIAIPGTSIVIPPTNRDVWLSWSAILIVTVAGEGNLQLAPFETTGAATQRGGSAEPMGAVSPAANTSFKLSGSSKVGPSAVQRSFDLRCGSFRLGGSVLAGNVFNGAAANALQTFLTAEAR